MDTKVDKLHKILTKLPTSKKPRLLIITDEQILWCYGNHLEKHTFIKPHGIITHLGLERGRILEIFSKIEFIINELIFAFIKPEREKGKNLDEILNCLDLFTKIKLLKQWSIIDNKLFGKLMAVKEVRNGMAHIWSNWDIKYRSRSIEQNFFQFRDDLLYVWKELVVRNQENQPNIDDLIKQFKKE